MRRVDPKVYTEKYYLSDCTGYEEFKKSLGDKLEPRFEEVIKFFSITPKMKILDIGCGRGEMVLFCARQGADAVGIDYSREAIKLAKFAQLKRSVKLRDKMQFYIMDAKKLKFENSSFDLVILTDVVEHLYPEELETVFIEVQRVLKKDGKLVVHTAPNKLFVDFGYKYYSYPLSCFLVSFWNFLTGKMYPNISKPKDLRTDSHAVMHINEPTFFSLRALYSKYNFRGSIASTNITAKKPELGLKDILFNFLVFAHPISRYFPVNIFLGSDFISVLVNKKI